MEFRPPPDLGSPITEEEIRTERSVRDLLEWIGQREDSIRKARDARLSLGHPRATKAFFEEVIPLGLMLAGEESIARDVTVAVLRDDGGDDARLLGFRPNGSHQPIQITGASWDYHEALRVEYLKKGIGISVNAFGPMTRDKETGNPQRSPLGFVRRELVWDECASKTVERINKKKGMGYAEGTWLVVEIRDSPVGDSSRNGLRAFVCEEAKKACIDSRFERVYLVSSNGQGYCSRVWG